MEPEIYKYKENKIRMIREEESLFVSISDIAKALGTSEGRIHTKPTCRVFKIKTGGGLQSMKMMEQRDVVALLFRSRKEEAEALRTWFMVDVLGVGSIA